MIAKAACTLAIGTTDVLIALISSVYCTHKRHMIHTLTHTRQNARELL